jgi:hypothetical protein
VEYFLALGGTCGKQGLRLYEKQLVSISRPTSAMRQNKPNDMVGDDGTTIAF